MSAEEGRPSIVTVRIAGEEHNLRTAADPEYTRECARYLDERIQEIRKSAGVVEAHRATILAALFLTDRYLRTERELERLRREVASRATNLARRIEHEESPADAGEIGH
ncbi:MAG: cell division protein ZapA [Gemmatimonadales bacterium]|nr:MAG: cell division protein ZapA [Gemmatimonadales bacterium]